MTSREYRHKNDFNEVMNFLRTPAANQLYDVTGFTKNQNYYLWNKSI
ncbi:hypothetical protein JW865_00830 [Candidatus Bathyarchaeota archaeon]|nr:hypothetical protein [Candidatus Bathyarchaeota archaeon]